MRTALSAIGFGLVSLYGVLGAVIMSDWAVVAASGMPLDDAVAAMRAADQPYTIVPGIVFAVLGVVLGAMWLRASLGRISALRPSTSLALWGAIIALGAPAYFFASFGNLNSVGDTFVEWHAAAAFQYELPLYVISSVGAAVAVAAGAMAIAHRQTQQNAPHRLAAESL